MILRQLEAFTLLELMVVLIIIGVIATLALPQFRTPRERALDIEAKTMLRQIRQAEMQYRLEFGHHYPPRNIPPWPDIWTDPNPVYTVDEVNDNLHLDLSDRNWLLAICTWPHGAGVHVELTRSAPPAGWDRTYSVGINPIVPGFPDEPCCCPIGGTGTQCLSQDLCVTCGGLPTIP